MDTLTPRQRSERMRLVRSTNTAPERALRRLVHELGFRYRLHSRAVVGRPDIANESKHIAIFLHGCFWHRHDCTSGRRIPKSRKTFWKDKFAKNTARDAKVKAQLRKSGWRTLVVWECELRNPAKVQGRVKRFLNA